MNRTLFVVGLALFVIGMGDALLTNHVNALTVALGVAAVLALVAATFLSPSRSLGPVLGKIAQLQTVLAGYSRESQIIEEYVYQVIEHCRAIRDPARAREAVERGVAQLASLRARTAESIGMTGSSTASDQALGGGLLDLFGLGDPARKPDPQTHPN